MAGLGCNERKYFSRMMKSLFKNTIITVVSLFSWGKGVALHFLSTCLVVFQFKKKVYCYQCCFLLHAITFSHLQSFTCLVLCLQWHTFCILTNAVHIKVCSLVSLPQPLWFATIWTVQHTPQVFITVSTQTSIRATLGPSTQERLSQAMVKKFIRQTYRWSFHDADKHCHPSTCTIFKQHKKTHANISIPTIVHLMFCFVEKLLIKQ